jgi:hypothetical protein
VSFALAEQVVFASHFGCGKESSVDGLSVGRRRHHDAHRHSLHADSVMLAMADVQLKLSLSPKAK